MIVVNMGSAVFPLFHVIPTRVRTHLTNMTPVNICTHTYMHVHTRHAPTPSTHACKIRPYTCIHTPHIQHTHTAHTPHTHTLQHTYIQHTQVVHTQLVHTQYTYSTHTELVHTASACTVHIQHTHRASTHSTHTAHTQS